MMRIFRPSAAASCAVALSLCISSGAVHGQTDEQRAGARSLATEGVAAVNGGRYKEAIDLLTRAETLMHAPPHLLYLARAYSKLGQYVKAREAYLRITKEQLPANASQAFRDAQATAHKEISAVDPKIASIEIKVEGAEGAKDLTVKVDGQPIPSVLIGAQQPIDPGEHRIEASATAFRTQSQTVRIADGGKAKAVLKLEPDPRAAAPAGPATAASVGPGAGGAAPEAATPPRAVPVRDTSTPTETASSGSGLRIGAYTALGVGAVGLGVGTVFLLQALGKRSDADAICTGPAGDCPNSRRAEVDKLDSDAKSAATFSAVGYGVGGVGIAAGVVMLIVSGRSESSAAAGPALYPWVGATSAGVAGRF
jgi:hypothetical protein